VAFSIGCRAFLLTGNLTQAVVVCRPFPQPFVADWQNKVADPATSTWLTGEAGLGGVDLDLCGEGV